MKANILKIIHQIAISVFGISPQLAMLQREVDENKILAARVLINQIKSLGLFESIQHTEFKVFSQWAALATFCAKSFCNLANDAMALIHGVHAIRVIEDVQCISVRRGLFLGQNMVKSS